MRWNCPSLSAVVALLLMTAVTSAFAQVTWLQNDDGTGMYYAGRPLPGDTVAVWFQPPTECKVLAAKFQFYTSNGGAAQVFVWRPIAGFNPANYDDYHVEGDPASTPLGAPWAGPIPYVFNNSGNWQTITFSNYGYTPDMMNVGHNPFFVGYKLEYGNPYPYDPAILMDAGDDPPFNSLCYLTNPQAPNPNEAGWWAFAFDCLVRAQVNMYGDPPPVISGLADKSDTYLAGPYTISCFITDHSQGGGQGQVTQALLHYSFSAGPWNSVSMTHVSDSTYTGVIPAAPAFTNINYYVEAQDNAGHTTISPNEAGYVFSYLQPTADLLLVNDKADVSLSQVFYTNALQAGGYDYDLWVISSNPLVDQGYPGTDVLNPTIYNAVIWFTGAGNSGSLPDSGTNLSQDPPSLYMNGGGNFFLSSADYLGKGLTGDPGGYWTEFTYTAPGTFVHDYLKVGSGWSDAHLGPDGYSQDTVYYGVAGDPISGPYTTPFQDHPDPNWNDFCYPYTGSGAVTCFYTQIDNESAGLRYSGGYKMVFLPWTLEAVDVNSIGQGILLNVLNFFGGGSVPPIEVTMTPVNPPIVIPANGGSFNFNAAAVRNSPPQSPFIVWARIRMPYGLWTDPTLGPVAINPPVGVTVTRTRTQNIPGYWAPGNYFYVGYANATFGYPAVDSSFFTFTKSADAVNGPWVNDFSCTGEPFPYQVAEASTPPPQEFVLQGASPNPFNPSTTISYQLPVAGLVSLKVYDVTGRLVATLAEGMQEAGQHSVTFDGSGMVSGIYLYTLTAGPDHATGKMVLLK